MGFKRAVSFTRRVQRLEKVLKGRKKFCVYRGLLRNFDRLVTYHISPHVSVGPEFSSFEEAADYALKLAHDEYPGSKFKILREERKIVEVPPDLEELPRAQWTSRDIRRHESNEARVYYAMKALSEGWQPSPDTLHSPEVKQAIQEARRRLGEQAQGERLEILEEQVEDAS